MAACPKLDLAVTVTTYVVLSFNSRNSHEGDAHTATTASPPPVGFAEKAYDFQGPPKVGGVATADAVVADVASTATSSGELHTRRGRPGSLKK